MPLAFIFITLVCFFRLLQSNYYRRNFHKRVLWANVHRRDFDRRESSEAIFRVIFSKRKFHWTVQMIQQHCKSFNIVKIHSTLKVEIIQDSTNHSTWYKSFNVVKIHSTSQLQIIQRCTNHSMFWKSETNRAGLINFKVQWKTDIVYTIEIGQNCPLYNSTGYLWTQTTYFDLYI